MPNKKQLQAEIATLNDIKTLIESYEEIAAMRMRKVKKTVLQNRDFLSGLNEIYQRVMYTYKQYREDIKTKKLRSKWQAQTTNGKTVSVLASANSGLYGEIVKSTFDYFTKNVQNNSHDIVIIGKIGKQLYDSFPGKRNYKYFEISDTGVDIEKTKDVLDYILLYTNVIVYHGIFVSMLSQKPVSTFVTGKAQEFGEEGTVQEIKCIIEPSVEEVTGFFEKQILASIFEQTLYESSLSKFASRMISLDVANDNISSSLKKVNFASLKLKHLHENFDQIERISGITLWG